jgi:hypothetical protein
MRATALRIVFVILCGIGAAPLLVQTEPVSALHAGVSAPDFASVPRVRNIGAPRSDAADPSSCKAEKCTHMMATRPARPLSVARGQ